MTDKVLREAREALREIGATDFELVFRGKGRTLTFTLAGQRQSVSLSKGFKTQRSGAVLRQFNALKRGQERTMT